MNFRLLSHTMGYILWVEAGFLLLPALTACIYAETCWQQFLLTALLCATAGTVLVGIIAFQEPVTAPRLLFLALLLVGIVGLKLTA